MSIFVACLNPNQMQLANLQLRIICNNLRLRWMEISPTRWRTHTHYTLRSQEFNLLLHSTMTYSKTIAMDLHDQIKTLSLNDEFIKGRIKCLKEWSTRPLWTALSDWTLNDGIILFKNRVYVPNDRDIRWSIITETHESPVSGHPGHLKMLYLLKEWFYWPGMAVMTKQFTDGCATCQQMKTNTHPTAAPLMPIKSHAHWPFQQVTMDFITNLLISNGFDSIFIMVDQGLSKG